MCLPWEESWLAAAQPYIPFAALAFSLLVATAGSRIFKLVCAAVGFGAGAYFASEVAERYSLSCEAVIGAGLAGGAVTAVLAAAMVRLACGLAGTIIGGFLAHNAVGFCTVCTWTWGPIFLGRTFLPYWGTVGVTGAVCGAMCHWKYKRILILLTATLGAFGTAWAVEQLVELPTIAKFGIMLGVAGVGVIAQVKLFHTRIRARTVP